MRKRWKKITLFLLSPFILIAIWLTVEHFRGKFALEKYKRELVVQGETLDVNKLLVSPVADADNGASELMRLYALIQRGKVLLEHAPSRMKLIAPGKAIVGFRENSWIDEKTTNTWREVALDLATNKETLAQLRLALKKPEFDFKLDHSHGFSTNLLHLAPVKSLGLWFGTSFQNSLRNGENQAALEDLITAATLPRVMEKDRIAISELVRIAISSINLGTTWEALESDVFNEEQLALIQKAWEKNTFITSMVRSLRVERAVDDTYVERYRKSNDDTYSAMFPTWLSTLAGDEDSDYSHWWQQEFFRKQIYCRVWRFAWLYQDEKFYLEGMQQLIDDNRTGAEKAAWPVDLYWFGLAKAPRQNFYNNLRFGMSAQSLATLSYATVKSTRAETDRSMVLCAIALKRHLLRHGKPAPDLNSLVPEFLSSMPTDYMDGKPMKYRLNVDGTWLLYSVGDDGRDNGGDPSPAEPNQNYRLIWRGKDTVWPSPASREEIAAFEAKETKK